MVSNRGQEEQDARFWDSALEAQAVLLSPIISQHPAPPHVQLPMPLVALIGRNNNKKALHECILWDTPTLGPFCRCCIPQASHASCSWHLGSCSCSSPMLLAVSLFLPEAHTLLLVNNKSEVLPSRCSLISCQEGYHGFLMRLQLICPMLKAVVN